MTEWVQWVIGAAAVVTALGILVSKVVLPIARIISRSEKAVPFLQQITHEFSNNGGSTLKDKVDQASDNARQAKEAAERAERLIINHLESHGHQR